MQPDYIGKKNSLLLMMVSYHFLLGLTIYLIPQDKVTDALFAIPTIILQFIWCKIDAEQRGHHISKFVRLLIVLFCPIGLIFYLFQTRGTKVIISLLLLVVFICVLYASVLLGAILAQLFFNY